MKISKLILELGIGYIVLNALHKPEYDEISKLLENKMNDINSTISNVYNQINYLYNVQEEIDFKPKELKNKIKEVQKQIDEIDSEEVSKYILDSINK